MQSTSERDETMPEGHNKCRIISFRVSDHEYGAVEAASRKYGFKSVALFARSAILTGDSPERVQTPVDVDINRLWRRLEVLTSALEKLMAQVSTVRESIQAR